MPGSRNEGQKIPTTKQQKLKQVNVAQLANVNKAILGV